MNNFKKKLFRILKITKNILVNGFNDMFKDSKLNSIKKVVDEHKTAIISSTIVGLFIFKNIFTIFNYNSEIKDIKIQINKQSAINNQLKEDIEYYKTDEYILRTALEDLNLRPTKKIELYHGEVIESEAKMKENTNDEDNKQSEENVNQAPNDDNTSIKEDDIQESTTQDTSQ